MLNINDSNIRPGFNGQGQINLNSFKAFAPLKFKDATFSHYEFLDLDAIDVDSEDFLQVAIRDGIEDDSRIESFQVSFRNLGFLSSEYPPCIDTDGNIMEGRGRIRGAKKNGERWIAVAVYIRTDKSIKNTVTNGLIANKHKPQYAASFHDFVTAGSHLINNSELDNTIIAVDNWLYKEVGIGDVYDNKINGMVTKIRDAIMHRAKRDDSLILRKEAAHWHKWIKENLNLSKSQYQLVNVKDETYAERLWCRHILPAIMEERDPVNIIYYTTSFSPSDAKSGLKKSMEYLEKLYRSSFTLVNRQLGGVATVSVPETRPYIFLGAVPQIVQEHDIGGHNLISVNKYQS